MRVVVNTPNGHVGSALVSNLLDEGAELSLIARAFDKPAVKRALARGAALHLGSLDEPKLVRHAFEGADVVFWLTPPSYDAPDLVGRSIELATIAANAIREVQVPRVVHCSSFGAHLARPPGPIRGVRLVESLLDESGAFVTHIRPAYFMDNDLWAISSIRAAGSIFLPVSGSLRLPRIATRDIARAVCNAILAPATERKVIELEGPAHVSFDDAAAAIARAIGKPVAHVKVKDSDAFGALRQQGMSEDAAMRVLELYQALEAGTLGLNSPNKPQTATTTIDAFAREVFAPAYAASR